MKRSTRNIDLPVQPPRSFFYELKATLEVVRKTRFSNAMEAMRFIGLASRLLNASSSAEKKLADFGTSNNITTSAFKIDLKSFL
jgi:hypothetical protein